MAGWIKMPVRREVGLSPSDIVLDGDPAPSPKREHSPQFSANVCCGRTSGWIKMPLGTKVGLGPCHIVLNGDPAPPSRKGHSSPLFLAHVYCGHGRSSQLLLSSCNDFWCIKSWENLTSIACTFATSPVYCSHFTLENPKKVIFNSIIHACFRLFTLSQKKTNCYHLTHHTWKMSPQYLIKCKTFSSDWR